MTPNAASHVRTFRATIAREWLSYRINRFLHLHLGLMLVVGALALLAPPEAASLGAAWWVLNGVIYVASLSALLFGLSSAQAEADEFALLFTQPMRVGCWVAGKCTALATVALAAAALLLLPPLFFAGASWLMVGIALAAGGISVVLAWMGLALGLWIQDPVRGLIAALVMWCGLLFGLDVLLILTGGSEWTHQNPAPWVTALMLSPLDAYRVTLLVTVEGAAFGGSDFSPLARWWLDRPVTWLTICLTGWSAVSAAAAVLGAEYRRTR